MGFGVVGKFQVHCLLIKIAVEIQAVGNVVKNRLNLTGSNISSILTTFGLGLTLTLKKENKKKNIYIKILYI